MSLALKLTSLFVRQLSKPLANTIKSNAKDHPKFRRLCIRFAQFKHRVDMTIRLKLLNEENIKIRPLNDAKAIQTGASFLSEGFVFSVAAGALLFETWRSRRKETKRKESVEDDIRLLQEELDWIKSKLKEKTIIAKDQDFIVPNNVRPIVLKIPGDQGEEGQRAVGNKEVKDSDSKDRDSGQSK